MHLLAGLSFLLGGLKFKRQLFNRYDAWHYCELLIFAVIVAFVIPEILSMTMSEGETLSFSIGISKILIALYLAGLFFQFVTHRGVYAHAEENGEGVETEHEEPE